MDVHRKEAHAFRVHLASLAFFAVLTPLLFWKIIFTNEYSLLTSCDNSRQWYAWYQFATHCFKSGLVPLWDPYVLSGNPFIGEGQPGLFYPLNLFLYFISSTRSAVEPRWIQWTMLFSVFLLASFQYALSRALGLCTYSSVAAAACYAFGGYTGTVYFGHLGMFNSAIWTPLVFLFFLKAAQTQSSARKLSFTITAGSLLGISILGGHIVPPMYIFLIIAFFTIFSCFLGPGGSAPTRKHTITLVLSLIICTLTAGCFAAVQLIPSIEYSARAIRWVNAPEPIDFFTKIPYEIEGSFGVFPLFNLMGFLIPKLAYLTNIYIYFGILPIFLCLIAVFYSRHPYSLFFRCLLVISLLYTLGNVTVVHGLLYAYVPFLYAARIGMRALFISDFAISLLAGLGLEVIINHLNEDGNKNRLKLFLKYSTAFAVVLSAVVFIIGIAYYLEAKMVAKADFLNEVLLSLFMVILSLGMLYAFVQRIIPLLLTKTLCMGLLIIDVFSPINSVMPLKSKFDAQHNCEPVQFYKSTRMLQHVREDRDKYFRVDSVVGNSPNFGDVFRIFTAYGVTPTMLRHYYELRKSNWIGKNVLNLLNVKYVFSKSEIPGWERLDRDANVDLYVNKTYLPRAFLVRKAQVLDDDKNLLETINSGSYNPRDSILLKSQDVMELDPQWRAWIDQIGARSTPEEAGSRVQIVKYEPTSIALEVEAEAKSFLFLSEVFYPGWKAWVDEHDTPILKANYAFRALMMEPGRHTVKLVYAPMSFRLGLTTSLVTLAIWISILVIVRTRRAVT